MTYDDPFSPLLRKAIALVADRLGLDQLFVELYARRLWNSELLDDDVPPAGNLTRLLLACMAASRPIDAPSAIAVYECAPLAFCLRESAHIDEAGNRTARTEHFGPPRGDGYEMLRGSFAHAIAACIIVAADNADLPDHALPSSIHAGRDLKAPEGRLSFRTAPGGEGDIELVYANLKDETDYRAARNRLWVSATAPGSIIRDLAALLREAHAA